jgi:hypothetical protein
MPDLPTRNDAKRRQMTCGYAGGVDGINKVDTAILFPTDGIACCGRCAVRTPVETSTADQFTEAPDEHEDGIEKHGM